MSGERLTAPALLAHAYLAAGGQHAARWEALGSLWDDVTSTLGLTCDVPSLEVYAHLPEGRVEPPGGQGLLAAAESTADAVWQALAIADHDLFCVTVMMAPPRDLDCASTWAGLERTWDDIMSRHLGAAVVGRAQVLLALVARDGDPLPPGDGAAIARDLRLVRAAVPEPSSSGWWRHWDTIRLGPPGGAAMVWEAGPLSADARPARRLVTLAAEDHELQVDHFLWTNGDGWPAPLTRHLMHAARLRDQIRAFDDGMLARRLGGEYGSLIDDLSAGSVAWHEFSQDAVRRERLRDRLGQVQAAAIGLRARLDAMRLSVGATTANLSRAIGLMAADVAVGPLSEDEHLAAWFERRLDSEIAALDTVITNAQAASAFLGSVAVPRLGVLSVAPANGAASRSIEVVRRSAATAPGPCAVIFTALAVEYEAIREYLSGEIGQQAERGTLYEIGELAGARGSWRLVITQTGPGSATAGVQFERAVSVFHPQIAIFLGVAGGRKDVALGDVVACERVYDYESGKSTPTGFKPRMSTHMPAYRLVQRAQEVARAGRWQQRIQPSCPVPAPRAFVKPIATGGKVIADDQSAIAVLLDLHASDAVAVETEGHGFLAGAYVNPGVEALVVRGISDLMTGKSEAADEHWQPIASHHAAAFAVELLDQLGMASS